MGKRLIIPPYKSAVNLSKIFLEKLIISLKIYLAGNTSICPVTVTLHQLCYLKQLSAQKLLTLDQKRFKDFPDFNNAYGYDDISFRIIKMSEALILKFLQLLFNNCLKQRVFPNIWKMANVLPMHKKQ